ncbi:MAG: multidrug ABC transporter [Lachnospiraceae bacterium]
MMNLYYYYFALAASVIAASISQILLKKSASAEHASVITEYVNPYVIGGYGLLFLSMLLTIFAFSGLPYKGVPIVESFGYVLVMILSAHFFGERITKRKVLGTTLILLGIAIYFQ